MEKEKRIKTFVSFSLFILVVPVIILMLGAVYFSSRRNLAISFISIGSIFIFGVFIITVFLYIDLIRRRKSKIEYYRETLDEIESGVYFEKIKETKSEVSLTIIKRPPKKAICMISKLIIDDEKEILQCTSCESYFIKKYILDWLKTNDYCPVCRNVLIK